jgi:hypothetical protein
MEGKRAAAAEEAEEEEEEERSIDEEDDRLPDEAEAHSAQRARSAKRDKEAYAEEGEEEDEEEEEEEEDAVAVLAERCEEMIRDALDLHNCLDALLHAERLSSSSPLAAHVRGYVLRHLSSLLGSSRWASFAQAHSALALELLGAGFQAHAEAHKASEASAAAGEADGWRVGGGEYGRRERLSPEPQLGPLHVKRQRRGSTVLACPQPAPSAGNAVRERQGPGWDALNPW